MTSVIDNSAKAAEYLYHCKEMGIKVLPPDINTGEGYFTVEGDCIRYGLYAIKSLGRPVIDRIIEERQQGGPYRTLQDFIERTVDRDVNKRAIENLIKAGACDGLDGTRKQMITVFAAIVDQTAQRKKNNMSGQMSLFDLVAEEDKKEYEVRYPVTGEFEREVLLGFEKEVLGIYLSGHPLEGYLGKMKKNVTANAIDFALDEEQNQVKIADGSHVVIGGMISGKTIKYTRRNQAMAFIQVEDLTGTTEVIVFPKDYERYQHILVPEAKVFVTGHASVDEEQGGKVVCERIVPFDEVPRELWIQFPTKERYMEQEPMLLELLKDSDGQDEVVIYVAEIKAIKRLGKHMTIDIDDALLERLYSVFEEKNVKVVEKNIEKKR